MRTRRTGCGPTISRKSPFLFIFAGSGLIPLAGDLSVSAWLNHPFLG
jgi:hypothetical protein